MMFLPQKWSYDGIVMAEFTQVHRARRKIDGGTILVESTSSEGLTKLAEKVDLKFDGDPKSHQMMVSTEEMRKLTHANSHQANQVTELQKQLTLKEEQLRAHRRAFPELSEAQVYKIQADVDKTTQEVLANYKKTEGNQ